MMESRRLCHVRLCVDLISMVLIFAFYAFCSIKLNGFQVREWGTGELRTSAAVVSFLPAALLYVILRLPLGAVTSLALMSVGIVALSYANYMKFGLTTEPITWSDISNTANISIVGGYLSSSQIAAVVADRRFGFMKFGSARYGCAGAAVLLVLSASQNASVADAISETATVALEDAGLSYVSYDWPQNMELNGLAPYLIQTSVRHVPRPANSEEKATFNRLDAAPDRTKASASPRTIVSILCEACWNDETHFRDVFTPLRRLGFEEFRAVSSVYGGGTVNTTFEVLTGLPSASTALSGIIYQEYAELISPNSRTVAALLRKEGYRTVNLHNHFGEFWKRNIVVPKLGFDEFIPYEAMKHGARKGWWADDRILFDAALQQLAAARDANQPIYMYLSTVQTHGSYSGPGTDGVEEYLGRLKSSIDEAAVFSASVLRLDPSAIILIYGDHKPQLSHWFAETGVFAPSYFDRLGKHPMDVRFSSSADRDVIGDVPAFILSGGDPALQKEVATESDHKPFFCLSAYFGEKVAGGLTPGQKWGRSLCDTYKRGSIKETSRRFPDWLVSLAVLGR